MLFVLVWCYAQGWLMHQIDTNKIINMLLFVLIIL